MRILTYNVLYGGDGREALIRGVVSAIRPDIAIFTAARATPSFDTIADAVGPFRARGGRSHERDFVVIVSRWPIVRSSHCGTPWAGRKWIEATIQPSHGRAMTIVGVHLSPQLLWPCEVLRCCEIGAWPRASAAQLA